MNLHCASFDSICATLDSVFALPTSTKKKLEGHLDARYTPDDWWKRFTVLTDASTYINSTLSIEYIEEEKFSERFWALRREFLDICDRGVDFLTRAKRLIVKNVYALYAEMSDYNQEEYWNRVKYDIFSFSRDLELYIESINSSKLPSKIQILEDTRLLIKDCEDFSKYERMEGEMSVFFKGATKFV